MKDINRPVRKAFYSLLSSGITYNSLTVPVSDEKLKQGNTDDNYYVILASQTSVPDETKSSYDRNATIDIDIVTKFQSSVSKNAADDIADQIFNLLFPYAPHQHSLPTPSGFQFLNLILTGDRYLTLQLTETSHIVRRILTFSLRVTY